MDMILEGKVAIVTGGAMGIGKRYCQGLAGAGARVVVADIAEDAARQTAAEIGGVAVGVDISDEESARRMVAHTLDSFGRPDILVNNAAVFTEVMPLKPFDEIPAEERDR